MAKLHLLPIVILFSLFLVQRSLCADPLEISPNPSTDLAADSPPSPPAGAPFTSPPTSSPLASPPSYLSPSPPANSTSKKTQTPALSPADHTSKIPSTPTPAPVIASDISHENEVSANGDDSSGLKGGQRAGIVIGVIVSACVVGFVAMVYQKRQKNLRRSQYLHAVRGDFL